jgi:ribosomal-protein-alanine N-acetyltransferase
VSSVTLYVDINHLPAINLHEKIGFEIIEKVEDIRGQNNICYRMKLKLT